jgi:hypothetical protein
MVRAIGFNSHEENPGNILLPTVIFGILIAYKHKNKFEFHLIKVYI